MRIFSKKSIFKTKLFGKDEELRQKAGTYFVMSLDLKPLYNRDTKKIEFDRLRIQICKEIPNDFYEKIFQKQKPFFENQHQESISLLKEQGYTVGQFLNSFIEEYSKQKNIFLLIDEYDKPINDYLKESKQEIFGEQVITSDIALLMKTFIRTDIRREVKILSGRTDLEYIDQYNQRVLLEFKILRKSSEYQAKLNEGTEQIEKYKASGRYERWYLVLIDLETGDVQIKD